MKLIFKPAVIGIAALSILLSAPPSNEAKESGTKHVVVIDPAHGGAEKGVKLAENVYEKDVSLIIGKYVKAYLEKGGKVRVIMTRSSDRQVDFSDRSKTAAKNKADLFISIHINAGFGRNAAGFEVYFPGFNTPSGEKEDSGEIVKDMMNTRYMNESVRFSQLLRRQMEKIFPRKDRGLRGSPIRIIRELTIPSVIIETGFATNAADRKDLMEPKEQKAVAEAIGRSIEEYF